MRAHIAMVFCTALVSTSVSAGPTRNYVDVRGGCHDVSMLEGHVSPHDDKYLEKRARDWTDADLLEYEQILTDCLRRHPGVFSHSTRLDEPLPTVAPPREVQARVEQRINELMHDLIEPARAAQQAENASVVARQRMKTEQDEARAKAEQDRESQAEANRDAHQKQQAAIEQQRRAAIQKQAQRDRDAASEAKALAEREAPLIAATEKEASEAHRARLAAEKALEDVRQQVATAQGLRTSEDAAVATAKEKRLRLEREDARRKSEQQEDEALAKSCSVSADQFEHVVIGMSLREVRRVFGCTGSLASSTEIQGLGAFSVYDWNGTKTGTAATTTFNQGRLVAKTQNALD